MKNKKIDVVAVATCALVASTLIYLAWELGRGWK